MCINLKPFHIKGIYDKGMGKLHKLCVTLVLVLTFQY